MRKLVLLTTALIGTWALKAQSPYPMLKIDSIQYVNPQKLANPTANTLPDYIDPVFKDTVYRDTVRFEGIVITNPRIYGLSTNRKAAYIQRKGGGPWSGLLVMCEPSGTGATLTQLISETKFYDNFLPGFPVRVTGIFRNFQGETQMNLIRNNPNFDNAVEPTSTNRDTLVYSIIKASDLMTGNPNTGWVQQKQTAEQWEGTLVEVRDVTVYSVQISGNRTFWSVIDDLGNVLDVRDMSAYFRRDDNEDTIPTIPNTFQAPPVGTRLEFIKGIVTEYAASGVQRYGIIPVYPSDVKVCTSCPPTIKYIRRTPVVATSTDSTTLVFEITVGDTTLRTSKLHYKINGGAMDSVNLTPVVGFPNTFAAKIPPQTSQSVVTYWLRAEDRKDRQTFFPDPLTIGQSYLTTTNGVNSIPILQFSITNSNSSIWSGDSIPSMSVRGIVTGRNFVAGGTNLTTVQAGNGPNSAIFIQRSTGVDSMANWEVGDSVEITSGRVTENFNVTTLFNIRGNKISSGNALPAFETTLSIDSFSLNRIAYSRPWEGVLVRFDSVAISNINPDAPSDFEEFSFSANGAGNGLRVDDMNAALRGLNKRIKLGMEMDFIQGPMYFGFGNFKLIPRGLSDIDLSKLDSVAPVITILGNNPDTTYLNNTWVDAGATAIDNIDGDITNAIIVMGTVDTATAGTYTIWYKATDAWGNSDSLSRTVVVLDTLTSGVNELTYAQLKLFPNPANSVLNISADFIQTVPVAVTIYDVLGKAYINRTYTDKKFNDNISIAELPNGIYFVNFSNENGSRTVKLIINK